MVMRCGNEMKWMGSGGCIEVCSTEMAKACMNTRKSRDPSERHRYTVHLLS